MKNTTTIEKLIFSATMFNSLLGIIDRICQIIYYCLTKKKNYFVSVSIRQTALMFTLMPTLIHLFMVIVYVLFHREEMHTIKFKLKIFGLYLVFSELLFVFGVHKCFKNKYSDSQSDSIITTIKVVGAIHCMFVSLPQLLIIPINSSANRNWEPIDKVSLTFSVLFLLWNVGYYFLWTSKGDDFENLNDCIDNYHRD